VGNKALELLLERKALSFVELGPCQSKLGRESLFMAAASSRALKNGLALAGRKWLAG
jgi:hypothetical protein